MWISLSMPGMYFSGDIHIKCEYPWAWLVCISLGICGYPRAWLVCNWWCYHWLPSVSSYLHCQVERNWGKTISLVNERIFIWISIMFETFTKRPTVALKMYIKSWVSAQNEHMQNSTMMRCNKLPMLFLRILNLPKTL